MKKHTCLRIYTHNLGCRSPMAMSAAYLEL